MRFLALMLIAAFSALSLGPPTEASSFSEPANISSDHDVGTLHTQTNFIAINIGQGDATFNERAASTFIGNSNQLSLGSATIIGPPQANSQNQLRSLEASSFIANSTGAVRDKSLSSDNSASSKAGPQNSIVE